MTANKAFYEVGIIVPHQFDTDILLTWLNRIEKYASVTVEGLDCEDISDISSGELDRKLRIPDPFSSIYILYLQCMIHLALGEYDKYSCLYSFYNAAFDDYAKWHMRNRI